MSFRVILIYLFVWVREFKDFLVGCYNLLVSVFFVRIIIGLSNGYNIWGFRIG